MTQEDWEFCLQFAKTSVPDELMNSKSFLWLNVFYPLLCLHKQKVLTDRGKWHTSFSTALKKEKFSKAVITEMEQMFYHSLCLLDFVQVSDAQKTVPLAKKLRILDSPLKEPILYLSQKYLQLKALKTNILDELKQEFARRAVEGKLADPLVNGEDLKALGVAENEKMAELLEKMYDCQLERQITNKKQLLDIFNLL